MPQKVRFKPGAFRCSHCRDYFAYSEAHYKPRKPHGAYTPTNSRTLVCSDCYAKLLTAEWMTDGTKDRAPRLREHRDLDSPQAAHPEGQSQGDPRLFDPQSLTGGQAS